MGNLAAVDTAAGFPDRKGKLTHVGQIPVRITSPDMSLGDSTYEWVLENPLSKTSITLMQTYSSVGPQTEVIMDTKKGSGDISARDSLPQLSSGRFAASRLGAIRSGESINVGPRGFSSLGHFDGELHSARSSERLVRDLFSSHAESSLNGYFKDGVDTSDFEDHSKSGELGCVTNRTGRSEVGHNPNILDSTGVHNLCDSTAYAKLAQKQQQYTLKYGVYTSYTSLGDVAEAAAREVGVDAHGRLVLSQHMAALVDEV